MLFQTSFERAFSLIVVMALCGFGVLAQSERVQKTAPDKTGTGSIRGRVVMSDGSFVSQSIKVTLQTLREDGVAIYTDSQGQFEFPNLAPGNYKIEVDADRQRFELFSQNVQVFRGVPSTVTLSLKEKSSGSPLTSRGNLVSARELERKVPSNARKEFEKASHSADAGKTDDAIDHLRKAIALYPDYVMAYNDLGTYLMAQGKLEAAAAELRRAVSLDDKAFNPALNLGIVLVHQNQFAEAADILRKALAIESSSPAVHLYSGLAAAGLGNTEVADKELKAAYSLGDSKYAIALFHLGRLYMNSADRDLAVKFFERYLKEVPDATNADQVQRMIAVLRR